MGVFISELKRRNVFRVGAAYAIVSWLIVQVIDIAFPRLGLPDWTITLVLVLLLIGLPVALILAWAFELTPDGVKKAEDTGEDQSVPVPGGQKLNFLIAGALVAALGFIAYQNFSFGPDQVFGEGAGVDKSVAVLPFDDLSEGGDQEWFSDGLTEEILNSLARLPELRVISRTSSFYFRDQDMPLREIAERLDVAHIVEGSVRRSGNRFRVTAQLIDAASGFHIWSERYDRALADIFAVQSELAEQIMGAVGTEIQAAEVERIRRRPTEGLTAHDLMMRAVHHYMKFTRKDHARARPLLERAIELDPEYAVAHAILSGIDFTAYGNFWSLDPTLLDRALERAERALAIDASSPYALLHKAIVLLTMGRAAESRALAERAVELDPNWDVPHTILAFARMRLGDPLGALRSTRRALRRNPKLPPADLGVIAEINYHTGRTEVALQLFERIRASNPDLIAPRLYLLAMYDSRGRDDEAQTLVQEILGVNPELTADLVANSGPVAVMFDARERTELRDQLRRAGLP